MKSFRKHLSEVAAVKPRKAPKKFPGYWAGKDSAKASRNKMVGGESVTAAPSGQDYLEEFENFNDKVNNGVDVIDRGEYDREGSMVKDNLTTIHREIKELYKLLGDDENLPEWVQEKIAQAKGMITSASEYMQTQHERDPVNELSVKTMSDYYKKRDADLRSKLQGAKTATATDKLKQMKLAVAKIKAKKTAATEIKEAPAIAVDPEQAKQAQLLKVQGNKMATVTGANPANVVKSLDAAGKGMSTPATAAAITPTLDDFAKVLQHPTLGPQLIALFAKAKQIK